MLHLKRASAGSGKTYELAKTYIRNLITIKEPGKRRRLRTEETLPEALREILAVTFTVKATAEMKMRIVQKLAALANADNVNPSEYKDIDYLEEFLSDLKVPVDDLAHIAKQALRVLVLKYSDFKVHTIDAFFQSILHTFTYEASLDENFAIEIDTDYLASVGFDAALDNIVTMADDNKTSAEALHWLRTMMREEQGKKQWNVFSRQDNDNSLYHKLIKNADNLSKEEFQGKRRSLTEYFEGLDRPFREIVEEVDKANLGPLKELHAKRAAAARELMRVLALFGFDEKAVTSRQGTRVKNSIGRFDVKKLGELIKLKSRDTSKNQYSLSNDAKKEVKLKLAQNMNLTASMVNDIDSAYLEWWEANNEYAEKYEELKPQLQTWSLYRELLPQLMIVLEIANRKKLYLDSINTLEISDTAHILARIIGEDETPFVYERMGSRISHYLIDEFQDTSRLQWENLRPLLKESESRGEDNLIIGDAKQSIYRFRNADYRLITDEVEKTFSDVVSYTSDTPPADLRGENTNYRSKARIIKFNNYIFSHITGFTTGEEDEPVFTDRIKKIYENSSQAIPKKKEKENLGYVDIIMYGAPEDSKNEDEEKIGNTDLTTPGFTQLAERLLELHGRGYSFSDIGVLVNTNDDARGVVKKITDYNTEHPENKIPIISKENLLVSTAFSVKLIVHALEMIARGLSSTVKDNPLLAEPIDEKELFELIHSLQSPALPSIIEAVAHKFVPEKQRDEDAPFLAAFQDAVIDYCTTKTSDVNTFLKWWKRKAPSLRISTPENSEGVSVVTIHSSKGLEYKCVVIPYFGISFEPSGHSEWKWVKPSAIVEKSELLPPYLPVEAKAALAETEHAPLWERHSEEVSLDNLNKLYVGFTRAINELYVYMPVGGKSKTRVNRVLTSLLADGVIKGAEGGEERVEIISPVEGLAPDSIEYRYGEPLTPEEVAADTKKKTEEPKLLNKYRVNADRKLLRFEDGNPLLARKDNNIDPEESDPRSEGTLKHRILQLMEKVADLDKAVARLKTAGLISPEQARDWRAELKEALDDVEPYGWFASDKRVLNERTLLYKGNGYLRPDRIVIDREGVAVIVDYKFGKKRKEHKEQLAQYANRLISTGLFNGVKAYLWYIPAREVVSVVE